MTPWLVAGLVRLGTSAPFAEAAGLLAHFTGTTVSEASARRVTEAAGTAWVQLELAAVARLEADPVGTARDAPPGPPVQQLSVDGVLVPLVGGAWAEVKTLAIGTVGRNRDGAVQTTDLSYFARLADAETFGRAALGELTRRGTATAGVVVAVADGAPWIQGFTDLHCPGAVRIVDFPHAVGYLARAAQEAFGPGTAATSAWVAIQAHELKRGDPDQVLAALDALPGDPASTARDDAVRYLTDRRPQIAYAAFVADGFPIGSGCIESANKHVVQRRLKGAGMHWARDHVNPMLGLRTVVANDRWATAWPQIATHLRVQVRLTSAAQRRRRRAGVPPAAQPSVAAALPTAVLAPAAPSPPPRPKRFLNGRPTADHPWKRRLLPPNSAPSTLPPKL